MVRVKVLEWDIALFRLGHVPVSGRPVFIKKKKISRRLNPIWANQIFLIYDWHNIIII